MAGALKQQLQDDIKAAKLSGNRFVADTLSGLKAAILNEEVAAGIRDEGLGDEAIEKIIAREAKKRQESIKLYTDNGRPELAATEQQELEVLQAYLPEQLDEVQIRALVDEAIAATDSPSVQQMGQVIGAVKAKAGNTADGALVARIVKEQLLKTNI